MKGSVRKLPLLGATFAFVAFAFLAPNVLAQEAAAEQPAAPRITLIELTPHIAVNDAAALIEAMSYREAIEILDGFIANQTEQIPEAFYLLGLAHYQLGDYTNARLPAERAAMLAPDAPVSSLRIS
jgi:tetratricopeptide (TPR) repeat protein